jgi:hypothetical protein
MRRPLVEAGASRLPRRSRGVPSGPAVNQRRHYRTTRNRRSIEAPLIINQLRHHPSRTPLSFYKVRALPSS